MTRVSRRSFLTGAAALAASRPAFANIALPNVAARTVRPREGSKIDTTIVVMQENRSVDHYLGWYAAENAAFNATQTATYVDPGGNTVPTESWGVAGSAHKEEYSGCGFEDPGHGWENGRVQRDHGFLAAGSGNDEFAVSWYGAKDVPVHAALVRNFATFDNYFCSVLTSTYPNREYMHSCQGLKGNQFPPQATDHPEWMLGFTWPTIWDSLTTAGVTWAYYFSNLPVVGLWGRKYVHGSRHISNFWDDAAAGQLPQVCFVDPYFTAPEGLNNDDHPHADLRLGQQFLHDVTTAVLESPHWPEAALFITYDEWGGFWDHVAPPKVADPRASAVEADDFSQLGFRVPTMLISPYVAPGQVDHGLYDHTSIVKFIENNYGRPALQTVDPNARDAGDRDIGAAFDFASPPRLEVDPAPFAYSAPPEAYTTGCGARTISDLFVLAENGWFDAMGFRTDWRFEDTFRR